MFWVHRWWYYIDIINMIEEIEVDRKKMLLIGERPCTTFATDLKIRLRR